jgi:hypothetical protein
MKLLKDIVRIAAFPLTVLILLVGFLIVYRLLGLPPSNELIDIARFYSVRWSVLGSDSGSKLLPSWVHNCDPGSSIQ